MAATRMTLSNTKVRRESSSERCPTCGTTRLRDGRMGAFNRTSYCTTSCYSKYRTFNLARVLMATGNRHASLFNIGPIPPGAV
jgi:hypothetical protein